MKYARLKEIITEVDAQAMMYKQIAAANREKAAANRENLKQLRKSTLKQKVAAIPKTLAPSLSLDTIWRQVESVVSQVYPDGDPIDWLMPWFRKQGIPDHKVSDLITKAAKKHGYKDMYAYYDSMADDLG